ncbi:MAG: UPF0175 family protein [Candidatus Methanospirareceae archaeon]
MLRRLIGGALKDYSMRTALELYSERQISLWKAAEMAEITYRAALEELKKAKNTVQLRTRGLDS